MVTSISISSAINSRNAYESNHNNSSLPGQNGRHFADDNFKRIFKNEMFCISIQISLKIVPNGQIYHKSALVQVMARRRASARRSPEPLLIQLTDAYMRHWKC